MPRNGLRGQPQVVTWLRRRYVLSMATLIDIIMSAYALGGAGALLLARHGVTL